MDYILLKDVADINLNTTNKLIIPKDEILRVFSLNFTFEESANKSLYEDKAIINCFPYKLSYYIKDKESYKSYLSGYSSIIIKNTSDSTANGKILFSKMTVEEIYKELEKDSI